MGKDIKLDTIDKDIIRALDENARLSATEISQWAGYSKQLVSYRIRRMISLGILDIFSAIINKSKLGYFHCQIYLKFDKKIPGSVILERIRMIPSLHWEAATSGAYDLAIFFLVKSPSDSWQIYQNIISQFAADVSKKEILLTSRTHYLNHAFLTDAPRKATVSETPQNEAKLKQRDLDLLNGLKERGRIEIAALAKIIKQTPYTIRQRIKYLKRKGIITDFKIRINSAVLGFRHSMILISLPGLTEKGKEKFIQAMIKEKNVIRATETIGRWDLICDVVLPKEEKCDIWFKGIAKREKLAKHACHILKLEKVLPINTVTYK